MTPSVKRLLHSSFTFQASPNLTPNDFGFHNEGDPDTGTLRLLTLKIAGVDRSYLAKADSLSGLLQTEGRDSLRIELFDPIQSYRPAIGEPIEVLNGDTTLIRGIIDRKSERYFVQEALEVRHTEISGTGAGFALDRRIVNGTFGPSPLFSVVNHLLWANQINRDVWGAMDFAPFPGPDVEAQRFQYANAKQALQRAVTSAGGSWIWWMDWNGAWPLIHIRDVSTDPVAAPWDIADNSRDIIEVDSVDEINDNFANRVYVRTEFENVSEIVDNFVGNGLTKTFPFTFPPTQLKEILVDGTPATFGTISGDKQGSPPDLTKDFYYQPVGLSNWWSHVLDHRSTFDDATPPIGSGLAIQVTYEAQTGNASVAQDTASQAARYLLEQFGSGVWEKVVDANDIASAAAAQQFADSLLAQSKVVPKVIKYRTFRHGLRPGMTQHITLTKHNLDDDFVIQRVGFREVPNSYNGLEIGIEYTIEAATVSHAVDQPYRLFEDLIARTQGGSDPVTVAAESATPGAGGSTIATFLFPGTSADPETPITGDDLTYRFPLLPGVGNYYKPLLAVAFVTEAPTTTAVQVDIRYIDPDGVDRGSIFEMAPASIATSSFRTTVTAFSPFGLVLQHGGHLEADCDQTDAAAKRLGVAIVLEVH